MSGFKVIYFGVNFHVKRWVSDSKKQSCIVDSTMDAEYVAACEAAKEAVWVCKFLSDLKVIPDVAEPITLYGAREL